MTKLPVAAGLALALTAGSAFAADLPRYKAPPPPPPPMFTWTGLYVGVNIGYGFGNGDPEIGNRLSLIAAGVPALTPGPAWNVPVNLEGVTGGGQIGFNYQFLPWLVLGVETDIQAADIHDSQLGFFPRDTGGNRFAAFWTGQNVDWWGTLRGRVGLTPFMPNLMVYGTAGLAYGWVNKTFTYADGALFNVPNQFVSGTHVYDNVDFGWTAGGGIEWAPLAFPNWSLRVEYLYVDLGTTAQTSVGFTTNVAGVTYNTAQNISPTRWHTVRGGVNYRFNLFGSPVVASF